MLLEANWTDKPDTTGSIVKRGSFVTSQARLATEWGWSRSRVQRFLNDLQNENQVEQQTSSKRTQIRLTNYEEYQAITTDREQQTSSKPTAKRAQHNNTTNIHITSFKDEDPKAAGRLFLGEHGEVNLSAAQFSKLADDLGAERAKRSIDFLDSYIATDRTGKRRNKLSLQNHNLVLRGWVQRALNEEEEQTAKTERAKQSLQAITQKTQFKSAVERKRERETQAALDFVSAPELIPSTRRIER